MKRSWKQKDSTTLKLQNYKYTLQLLLVNNGNCLRAFLSSGFRVAIFCSCFSFRVLLFTGIKRGTACSLYLNTRFFDGIPLTLGSPPNAPQPQFPKNAEESDQQQSSWVRNFGKPAVQTARTDKLSRWRWGGRTASGDGSVRAKH